MFINKNLKNLEKDLKIIGSDDLNMNEQTSIELGWTFPTTHQDIAKHWIQMRHSLSCHTQILTFFRP